MIFRQKVRNKCVMAVFIKNKRAETGKNRSQTGKTGLEHGANGFKHGSTGLKWDYFYLVV